MNNTQLSYEEFVKLSDILKHNPSALTMSSFCYDDYINSDTIELTYRIGCNDDIVNETFTVSTKNTVKDIIAYIDNYSVDEEIAKNSYDNPTDTAEIEENKLIKSYIEFVYDSLQSLKTELINL